MSPTNRIAKFLEVICELRGIQVFYDLHALKYTLADKITDQN